LADVATERVAVEMQMLRQRAAMLDRRVADAAFRRNGAIREDLLGGTGIDAARACAAAIGDFAAADIVLERSEKRADEKVRAMLFMDQHAVAADPSESRLGGGRTIGERTGIDIPPCFSFDDGLDVAQDPIENS